MEQEDLLKPIGAIDRLRLRAHRASRAQYLAGKRSESMHQRIGIPAVVLSTVVGTVIFSSLSNTLTGVPAILAGLTSIAAAVMSTLQTFFGYAERAARHRESAARYASLKRRLDILKLRVEQNDLSITGGGSFESLSALIEEINAVEQEAPDVSDRLYDQARKEQADDTEGI